MSALIIKCWSMVDKNTRRRIPILLFLIFLTAMLETLGVGMVLPLVQLLADPLSLKENQFLSGLSELVGSESTSTLMLILANFV